MNAVQILPQAALAIQHGRIAWIGREGEWHGSAIESRDLGNRAVVPGLVEPHTHAVWAGDRLADFEARSSGKSYESILQAGGGIRSTIQATASAEKEELRVLALPRIQSLVRSGATTIEVKSGYGFTPEAELKMLETISLLAQNTSARIIATLLIHIPPSEHSSRADYLDAVCTHLIPEVARRKLATAVDVFVEKEAWLPAEAEQVFRSAQGRALSIKLHSEQFHSIGGLEMGVRMHALSIDHLEACSDQSIRSIAASNTIATILPGVSLHLGIPAASGRKLIDAGAAVAVGTDLNPGSSPLYSTAEALALAVRLNGLTPREALIAGTVNAAAALGLEDTGSIRVGAPADLLVLNGSDWRDLVYSLGTNPVAETWIGGKKQAL
ncbi:MAG: imidazolonepropionase [Acidobacteriaceae bacterium]